jgi:myo-inositol catabolism protein IolH
VVGELGYDWIELSPRDVIPFFRHPRVDDGTVAQFRKALDSAGVGVSRAVVESSRNGGAAVDVPPAA